MKRHSLNLGFSVLGLLPEPFILGVATRIGKYVNPINGTIMCNRVLRKIA